MIWIQTKERKKGLTVFVKVHPEINKPSRTNEDLGEIPKVPGVQKARKALVVLGALETYAWKTYTEQLCSVSWGKPGALGSTA